VIRDAGTPEKARMLGHQKRCSIDSVNAVIKKFKHVKIKENWNETRDSVMQSIIDAKFVQNLGPQITLRATKGSPIIKWCPRDYHWGYKNGKGDNALGIALESTRTRLLSSEL
jgi:predicted NAD-dependent protein-ADP-ribosyltransferase YbiA (DUF1768 family)